MRRHGRDLHRGAQRLRDRPGLQVSGGQALGDYSDRLTQAATDETSKQALAALAVYVERNAALDSGAIPEFADQQGAEEALKRGENPEMNPAYTQALAEATTAHATLTTCMPHWPVVF